MDTVLEQLLHDALARHGIADCGIIDRAEDFPAVAHDEREAPYAVDDKGNELLDMLVSITDEDDERMLAWARVPAGADVLGIGIDLASTDDFLEDNRGNRFSRLLFTPAEKELIEQTEGSVPERRAMVFSAKEAAFKSTAAPLRRWYDAHDEELFFEAMDFELRADGTAGGHDRPRRGNRADGALEALGIERIETSFTSYKGMIFCIAVALKRTGGM